MRSSEDYVRPPLVASEPSSAALARWRYRVVALTLLVLLVGLFVWVLLRVSNVTGGEDPGLIGSLPTARAAGAPPA
ncbi:MAG: hypothetical protein WCD35_01080 [Mycobacteriales bacterium]